MPPYETELRAGDLLLRTLQPSDAGAAYAAVYASRREVGAWLPWCHENYQRAEMEEFIAKQPAAWVGESYAFGIFDATSDEFLGSVALNYINRTHHFANLGYWVATDATRRGVASTAARRLAQWGLQELGLQRVEILAQVANIASQRAAEKAGARREAVLRNRLRWHDKPLDGVLFSLIPEDFA